MHQSRISDSLGFDFTEHFTVEGQHLAPARIMDEKSLMVGVAESYSAAKRVVLI
jgi:hypothetical protein